MNNHNLKIIQRYVEIPSPVEIIKLINLYINWNKIFLNTQFLSNIKWIHNSSTLQLKESLPLSYKIGVVPIQSNNQSQLSMFLTPYITEKNNKMIPEIFLSLELQNHPKIQKHTYLTVECEYTVKRDDEHVERECKSTYLIHKEMNPLQISWNLYQYFKDKRQYYIDLKFSNLELNSSLC